jgi:hypothetical protein
VPYRATLFAKAGRVNWLVARHQDTALPPSRDRSGVGGPWRPPGLSAERGSGEADYYYVSVGGGQPAEILGVSRQSETSAQLHRCGDNVSIRQVLRANSGSSQDTPDEPG